MQKGIRIITILSLLVIAVMIVAACGGGEATPAPAAPVEQAAPAEATVAEVAPTEAPAEAAPAEAAATEEATPTEAPAEEAAPAAEGSDRSKTLIMDIDGGRLQDPEGVWNPYVPGNRRDQGFHQVCLEPLFILNYQTGEFIPWLAESFTSNDTLDEWTLTLRDGVKWQDGVPFTADDVVFTIQTLIDNAPELGDSAAMKQWVKSVEMVDDLTVKFMLNEPNPRFQLDYFAVKIWGSPEMLPKHIWEGQDPLTFKNFDLAAGLPMCTGPYKLASTSPTEVTWTRDDNWWGVDAGFKLPEPETIIWTWAGPPETRAALMANGELDSLMDITLGALQALQAQNPNVITWFADPPFAWVPDPCSRTFEFNTSAAPWDDPEMRWAINYLIDRDKVVEVAYENTTLKSRHFFPAYPPLDALVDGAIEAGAWDLDKLWTVDPAKAAEIIESKGYTKNANGYYEKDGKELTLDITTHEAYIEQQRIAQVIVEDFQAAGINATTRNEAGSTWDENFSNGTFEAREGWQTCGSVNEPWASMEQFNAKWLVPVGERASYNRWRWSGPKAEEFGKLTDEIGSLPLGDPKIQELFNQAMTIYMEELPVIPVTQAKKIIPFDTTYWTNWPTYDNQYIHPPTWWQQFHVILQNLTATGAQ
ncbi:ABC transporter substrate-binding protein [Caldilinea sp.]|uniref:ABC transporter substrate-binding protein n=1 Tax=Caldilinea sp. TaxID=2293560 RepID=UPI002CD09299|nr:ABC transporter substrate-binding protein [Caldilinea sp.]